MYIVTIYDDNYPILTKECDTKEEAEEFVERCWFDIDEE